MQQNKPLEGEKNLNNNHKHKSKLQRFINFFFLKKTHQLSYTQKLKQKYKNAHTPTQNSIPPNSLRYRSNSIPRSNLTYHQPVHLQNPLNHRMQFKKSRHPLKKIAKKAKQERQPPFSSASKLPSLHRQEQNNKNGSRERRRRKRWVKVLHTEKTKKRWVLERGC